MIRRIVIALAVLALAAPAAARSPVPVGSFPSGPVDGITDVPGVRVGQVTKIEGEGKLVPGVGPVRTGATGIIPNDDPWVHPVAAAQLDLNGNGEMTGAHFVNEEGFVQTPIVLTDTMGVGRADDGVLSWLVAHHPDVGTPGGDVPLPVVAECADVVLNDVQGRHVTAADVQAMLDAARPGDFVRGNAGAGTGMLTFGFKGGIGSASRVLPAALGGYTVGVLVNNNTGSQPRADLRVGGVRVGEKFGDIPQRVRPPRPAATAPRRDGSIVIVLATNAPLDHLRLLALIKRAYLGIGRVGLTSNVSSGDLGFAFSTTSVFDHDGDPVGKPPETDSDRIDALYRATADAAEAAVYDSIFSARTMTGANGITVPALPFERVAPFLK